MKFKLPILIVFYIFSINQLFAQTLPHTFTANSAAKAEEVNENFQFLANQFKVNKKTIDCSTDNMTKAIEDGYNHLVINGTCTENLLITQFIKSFDGSYSSFGFTSNKPVNSLTLEGGTLGVWDNTNAGLQASLIYSGVLNIINLTVSQPLYLNNGARLFVNNSSLENVSSNDGSSAEINNSTLTCTNSNGCVYLEDSGTMKLDNVTVTNSGSSYTLSLARSSSAEIKNSTINNTNTDSDSKATIGVQSNSSLQLEDTNVTSNNNEVSVGTNGYLNLNGGSIKRTNGSPTIKVYDTGIFHNYNSPTFADITCDGKFASFQNDDGTSTSVTNSNGADCQ